DVGAMDDALFIDNVDLDWCFRARVAGYALYGVCAAGLDHRLGDARRRLPGLPRGVVVHAPRRLFYMMRNRVLLYRRAYTPRRWIAQDVPRLIVKFLLFALLIPPRWKNVRSMLAGLRAGIAGRAAPPPDVDCRSREGTDQATPTRSCSSCSRYRQRLAIVQNNAAVRSASYTAECASLAFHS